MLIWSLDVQEVVDNTQFHVWSVRPFKVNPPPSAAASVVEADARTMFLSPTSSVVELIVVTLPLTVSEPLRTSEVPVAAPMSGVISVGVLARTTAPEPVEEVCPVPPDATASVADNPAAVPVVFWFKVGKSAATAIDGAPVVVVFLSIPVARPDINTPLIFTTVNAVDPVASPVWVTLLTNPE